MRCVHILENKTYICPGCLFLDKHNTNNTNDVLECLICKDEISNCKNISYIRLYKAFYIHNKNGYRCSDCKRFIPHPIDNSSIVSCPYPDCYFVGFSSSLRKMHHPSIKEKIKDISSRIVEKISNIDNDLYKEITILKNVITEQMDTIFYRSSNFTIKNKIICYTAYLKMIDQFPKEMVEYLLHNSRRGGFQQRIFQEYISLLDRSLPYSFKKNGKLYKIEHLLDKELNLFDGVSSFDEIISDKLEIKNNTQEFYIGGRKASYAEPFYIGKLLNVIDNVSNISLMDRVVKYGFFKIKMRDINPGTNVTVTHLRVPPHYQMGGMVYINRIRKNIVDQAKLSL